MVPVAIKVGIKFCEDFGMLVKIEKYRNAVQCKDNLTVHTPQKMVETELISLYSFFFFFFSFTSLSSFFTHIETNQSVGGAKTGVPEEKPPDTPASRTWLVSHMNSCPVRGANPHSLYSLYESTKQNR